MSYSSAMRAAGEATRDRILAAAKKEFAQYGVAGARINRIANDASASKERLYAYFPSKEALFAAVTERLVSDFTARTALFGDDLSGYAGLLFDMYIEQPDSTRLSDWLDLQADDELVDGEGQARILQPKIDEIRHGQQAGHIDSSWDPVQLYTLVFEIARTMAAPNAIVSRLGQANGSPDSVESRRQAVVTAVERLITPAP